MESVFTHYAWLIPLLPLIAFLILISGGRQMKESGAYIGILLTLGAFILSILVLLERLNGNTTDYSWNNFEWIKIGDFTFSMGFEVTNLNALMLVIVTFVSLLVNIYSKAYMHDDERISVFFSYVALFTFSMLGLVISENLIELYIFWELVGVCSFLLVGFWYYKPEAKAAAKKAFIVTRIGDVGLFLAILVLFWYMPGHYMDFNSIHNAIQENQLSDGTLTLVALLIFVGAMGKSGQFPLHTWLPDAMEGPTPISALIHAATMVAAGVYLVARTFVIFLESPLALDVVAYVGGFTAIFAATIALTQSDLKRVLAYSTVSQLGYMMMALGLGTWASYSAGIFHLFTHAFFKALLFLAAGSVIHAIMKQNIHEMGGLAGKMKITAWTFAIGALALSGIAPLSGFWSKDAILTEAYTHNPLLFYVGLITAFFTAFYMARLFFLVFMGKPRSAYSAHESPSVMTVPLIILAAMAVVAGFVFMPTMPWLGEWLTGEELHEHTNWTVILLSNLVGVLGILLGWAMYLKQSVPRDILSKRLPWIYQLSYRKFYIDELYHYIIIRPLKALGDGLQLFDHYVVDGLVRLTSNSVIQLGKFGARLQNGQLQNYGLITLLGFIIIAAIIMGRRFL